MSPRRIPRGAIRVCLTAVLCAAIVCGLWTPGRALTFPSTADEVKLGAKIAKQIDSHYPLVTDPAQLARLDRVGDAVAKVVPRQDLTYHFQIIATNAVNSLAVPGGWVYVTEGMMRFVRTDDELAAVLAHELTHINHRDYYIEQDRSRHMTPGMFAAVALSVLLQSPAPLLGAQVAIQGAMSSYQRDLEQNADLTGVSYLMKTQYSPVAMLTLMEHFVEIQRLSGQPEAPAIQQDHPYFADRAAYIKADLQRLGIPIIRRIAEGYLRITLDPVAPQGEQPVTIRVDGQPVLTLGAIVDGATPAQRAEGVAAQLNKFFDRDPAPFDVRAGELLDRWSVIGDDLVLYDVTPQDAGYLHVAAGALAQAVQTRLADVIAAAPYNRKF